MTILLSILEVVFEIVIPLCMSDLIDFGIEAGAMNVVWKYGVILLMLAVLELGTGFLCAWVGAKASVGFAANLREDTVCSISAFG